MIVCRWIGADCRRARRSAAGEDELQIGHASDESAHALRVPNHAVHRNRLARGGAVAYCALIDTERPGQRKNLPMNAVYTTPAAGRIVAFIGAAITSAIVLGSTVAGMQPRGDLDANLIAMHRAVVGATATR